MIITLLNWIYIAVTTFFLGWFAITRINLLFNLKDKDKSDLKFNVFDCLFGGIMVATVYAEYFSLIGGVSLVANIVMIAACIAIFIIWRKDIGKIFVSNRGQNSINAILKVLLIVAAVGSVILCLVYTAQSSLHYDTGLYHAQSIHWLEDYGVIKGLGRIHVRFAYNSAYFPVCALYSFKAVCGQSLHSVSGYIFALICSYCVYGWFISIRNNTFLRKSAVSDLLRIAPFYYLLCILLEITSPESDYAAIAFMMWIVLRFVEISERDHDNVNGYCLVSIAAFMAVSYKLSTAPVALISLLPICLLIRKKKYGNILSCMGIVAVILAPWLIRNYYICGWLIYPVSFIDLFNPAWKFSKEMVAGDAGEIGAWAMELQNGDNPTGIAWLRLWWSKQNEAAQLFVSSLIMSVPIMILICLKEILALFIKKIRPDVDSAEKSRRKTVLFLIGLLIVTLAFYMKTAPLIRYCYGPVLILPLITVGYILSVSSTLKRGKIIATVLAAGCVITISIPSAKSCKALLKFDYEETTGRFNFKDTLIKQIDYPKADVHSIEWCGMTVYLPNEGDQCWYDAFPSSPYTEGFKYTTLIGDDLSEGVVQIQ